jgi:hypothetical protein
MPIPIIRCYQRAAIHKNPPVDSLDALNYWNMNPLNVIKFHVADPGAWPVSTYHILSQYRTRINISTSLCWFMNNLTTFMEHVH